MTLPGINDNKPSTLSAFRLLAASLWVMIFVLSGIEAYAAEKQKDYASAEDAVKAFVAAIKSNDNKELVSIFGSPAEEVISSGDPVSDKQRRENFIKAFDLKNSIDQEGDKMVLIVGEKDWPFPIPLVKAGDRWLFDTEAGKEEILNRRIGENELNTIQTMLAIVDAQREYAMADRDGDGLLEYAEKFWSDTGKKNGLYWDTKEGEAPSPLGAFAASARAEGYTRDKTQKEPVPYHGYYFRIMKKQGKNAPGGAFDYVVRDNMIGGFAVVAYPATYGNSGVMTFMVNHDGEVYQKDLGENTVDAARTLEAFDPDGTWEKVQETSAQ